MNFYSSWQLVIIEGLIQFQPLVLKKEEDVSVTFLLQRIPDFHVLECSRMQYFRIRSRTNVTIRVVPGSIVQWKWIGMCCTT